MTIAIDAISPPCATEPEVYHDDVLQAPRSRRDMTASEWRAAGEVRAEAHRRCAGCPMLVDCLYRAVVEVDVSGFAACTTETDRARIRRELGITVDHSPESPFGLPRVGGGPVSHEAVMAVRASHPDDTCQQLAERLGCSTSTIKRHLRRARQETALTVVESSTPSTRKLPSVDEVLDCFDRLESSRVA